ncbi:hypothetical protein ABTZ03_42365 [Kitasatospora sp. NPDC096077]|uniref:hypothetical protein n=1 Tax=Kitasatospora sp. NPDC096077 TaxID=3155544 RepID=UPI0033302076
MTMPERTSQAQPETDPLLTAYAALVLLIAAVIGLIVGGLAFLSGSPAAGAVLAGLSAVGVSVPVLHRLIR